MNVTIFITHVRNCVMGATTMVITIFAYLVATRIPTNLLLLIFAYLVTSEKNYIAKHLPKQFILGFAFFLTWHRPTG